MQAESQIDLLSEFAGEPQSRFEAMPDGAQLQALRAIETAMRQGESPLPDAAVSDFPAPMMTVVYSPHRLDESQARAAVLAVSPETALPRGLKLERLAEALRPAFVPRWLLDGEIGGAWQAEGVETAAWEVDCPDCGGSGKTGGSRNRECERCWGSGKEKQTRKTRHPERGEVHAKVHDSLDNGGCGADLALAVDHAAEQLRLPDDVRLQLRCLRPASIYSSTATDTLRTRLAAAADEQAKAALKQYPRLENFQFAPESVVSRVEVVVWLYPVWLAGADVGGVRHCLVCDGRTGKTSLTQLATEGLAGADAGGTPSWWWPAVGATLLAGAAAGGYFLSR